MQDFYKTLGLTKKATQDEIKKAYRKLARKYHPDVNKEEGAEANFREATQAYEVLSDIEKRAKYDQFGPAAFTNGGGGGRPGGPQGWPGGMGGQQTHVNFEDMFGGARGRAGGGGFMGMGLDEILSSLGGGRRAPRGGHCGRHAQPPTKGADIEHEVKLDFLQAIRGAETSIRITDPHDGKRETISVKIPAGVKEGQKIRLRGKGNAGAAGPGDLLMKCSIKSHPYWSREGKNLLVTVPISITEAALGAKVDVPTLDGTSTVTVPAGSPSGRKLRLKGKGVTPAGKHTTPGDLYVVLKVVPPTELTDEARTLLETLAETDSNPRQDAPWS
jgi:DnaJ-class molecular chaperone